MTFIRGEEFDKVARSQHREPEKKKEEDEKKEKDRDNDNGRDEKRESNIGHEGE